MKIVTSILLGLLVWGGNLSAQEKTDSLKIKRLEKIYRNLEYNTIAFNDLKNKWYVTDPIYVREIFKARYYEYREYGVFYFEANGFLRSQIRLMVGALLNLNANEIQNKLHNNHEHKNRPVPPNGLYLCKINY